MRTTLLLSALLASAVSSHAAAITINNAGFESPSIGIGTTTGSATGWNLSGLAGIWNVFPNTQINSAPEGSQILYLGAHTVGDANQTLAATVQANTIYTLTFYLGQNKDAPLSVYSVALEGDGSTILATETAGAPTPGNFVTRTLTFDSSLAPGTVGKTLGIYIHSSGFTAAGLAAQALFDGFALNTSAAGSGTPEPATFGVIGAGLVAIAFARRRVK